MYKILQLFLMLSLFMATSLDLSAQTIDLSGTVTYTTGAFSFDAGNTTPFRVCPDTPIRLTTGDAAAACAALGAGVARDFFVTGDATSGPQTEIIPTQPGNTVQVDLDAVQYFRYCVRCNDAAGTMIESPILFFQGSTTTDQGDCAVLTALPVELSSFKGNNVASGISLEWITDSEVNNDGFEVEFSSDARSFETLDFVNGNGTTNETQSYQYTHKTNRPGSLYYRLKQMDFDGAFEYSDIIEVKRENNGNIAIFPNPAREAFTITVSNPNRLNAFVKVTDLLGKTIFATSFEAGDAPEFFEKAISSLTQQMYIVTTLIGTEITSHQVVNIN